MLHIEPTTAYMEQSGEYRSANNHSSCNTLLRNRMNSWLFRPVSLRFRKLCPSVRILPKQLSNLGQFLLDSYS
jgi:hypothetical protein